MQLLVIEILFLPCRCGSAIFFLHPCGHHPIYDDHSNWACLSAVSLHPGSHGCSLSPTSTLQEDVEEEDGIETQFLPTPKCYILLFFSVFIGASLSDHNGSVIPPPPPLSPYQLFCNKMFFVWVFLSFHC